MKFYLVLFFVACFSMTQALASNCSVITRDFAEFHFDESYYERPIKSVNAHVGSRINPGSLGTPYWANVQDIKLEKVGDHFEGVLDSTTSSGVYFPNEGMRVQYFITLESGEEAITRDYMVPVRLGHNLTYPLYPGHYCSDGSRGKVTDEEALCAFGEELKNFFQLNHQIEKTQRMSIQQIDC